MIEFAVDCKHNGIPFGDPVVMDRGYRKALSPGSYTVRITGGQYSPFADGADAEPSIMLWFLHDPVTNLGRHRDRSTNVVTHSQFRSLAGRGDSVTIDVFENTSMYAFWFDEYGADNSGVVELTIDSDGGREVIQVNAANHSVTWSPPVTQDHAPASLRLPVGTHVIRIERGEFSYYREDLLPEPTSQPQPFVMLWAGGGRQADVKTGVQTPLTVRTLTGYGDTLVLNVTAATELKAFFLDSGPGDNFGSVIVRILSGPEPGALRALVIDGQSEHVGQNEPFTWKGISARLKAYLRQTGHFQVDHLRSSPYLVPQRLLPDFEKYDLVVLNYSSQVARGDFNTRHELRRWPAAVEAAFENYVRAGGGVVIVHSANNSFPQWQEYNRMTGVGGWYGRENPTSGPFVYYQEENGTLVLKRDAAPNTPIGGGHPPPRAFPIDIRDTTHPITRDLPTRWMHAIDELYQQLRGPAENLEILATAYSDPAWGWDGNNPSERPTGHHEPLLMTIRYGAGRIFHTALGHTDKDKDWVRYRSLECVGFITTFQRGAEWAATGNVTQPVPADFPTAAAVSMRPFPEPDDV